MPVAALAPVAHGADPASNLLVRAYEAITSGLHERAVLSAQKLQSTVEAATSGKVAAVAASAAAIAGGGVAVTGAAGQAERPAKAAAVDAVEHSAPAATKPSVEAPHANFVSQPPTTRSAPHAAASTGGNASQQSSTGSEFAPEPSGAQRRVQQQAPASKAETPAQGPGEFEP